MIKLLRKYINSCIHKNIDKMIEFTYSDYPRDSIAFAQFELLKDWNKFLMSLLKALGGHVW